MKNPRSHYANLGAASAHLLNSGDEMASIQTHVDAITQWNTETNPDRIKASRAYHEAFTWVRACRHLKMSRMECYRAEQTDTGRPYRPRSANK